MEIEKILKNRIVRIIFLILSSIIITILLFLFLGYTGIAKNIIDFILKLTGDDFYQGETKTPYVINCMLGILIVIFVIVFSLMNKLINLREMR